jgi:hypothetical protein
MQRQISTKNIKDSLSGLTENKYTVFNSQHAGDSVKVTKTGSKYSLETGPPVDGKWQKWLVDQNFAAAVENLAWAIPSVDFSQADMVDKIPVSPSSSTAPGVLPDGYTPDDRTRLGLLSAPGSLPRFSAHGARFRPIR